MPEFDLSDEAKLILHEDGSAELFKDMDIPSFIGTTVSPQVDVGIELHITLSPLEVSRLFVSMQEYEWMIDEITCEHCLKKKVECLCVE